MLIKDDLQILNNYLIFVLNLWFCSNKYSVDFLLHKLFGRTDRISVEFFRKTYWISMQLLSFTKQKQWWDPFEGFLLPLSIHLQEPLFNYYGNSQRSSHIWVILNSIFKQIPPKLSLVLTVNWVLTIFSTWFSWLWK